MLESAGAILAFNIARHWFQKWPCALGCLDSLSTNLTMLLMRVLNLPLDGLLFFGDKSYVLVLENQHFCLKLKENQELDLIMLVPLLLGCDCSWMINWNFRSCNVRYITQRSKS